MVRTLKVLVALSVVMGMATVAAASPDSQKPLCFHGGLGFGKMMEDGAPGGSVGFGLGLIYQKPASTWGFGLDTGYLMLGSTELTGQGAAGDETWDMSFNVLPVTTQIYKQFGNPQSTRFYVDGGLGLYNVSSSIDIPGGSSDSESNTDFGLNGGLGARFGSPDAKLTFGLDMKYHNVMSDESLGLFTALGRLYIR